MGEYLYNDRLVYYSESLYGLNEPALILLKSPDKQSFIRHNTADAFKLEDAEGHARNVIWIDFLGEGRSKGTDESEQSYRTDPSDRAMQLKTMMGKMGLGPDDQLRADVAVGDKAGAEVLREYERGWPGAVGKVYVPTYLKSEFDQVYLNGESDINSTEGHRSEVVFFECDGPESFHLKLRNEMYGITRKCPFCGETMDAGYIYGSQNSPAYWTEDDAMVGTTFEFGPVDKVMQLRSSYGKRKLSERLVGTSAEDYPRGYLCRSCGRMLIDMSPAMIYYKDEKYLKAHEGEIDPKLLADSSKPEGGLSQLFRSVNKIFEKAGKVMDEVRPEDEDFEIKPAIKEMDGKTISVDRRCEISGSGANKLSKKNKYRDDEPKRRSFFGRGPKVE